MNDETIRSDFLSPGPDDGDWTDVVRRTAGARRRRQVYGIVALAALAAVGVASAYALGHPVVDFGSAEHGSQKVIDNFGGMDVGAPPGMAPGVIAEQARRIPGLYVDGKPYNLWVAPTRSGGFCETGGCVSDRSTLAGHIGVSTTGNKTNTGVSQIDGEFIESGGDRLVLSYKDGTSDEIPFVWVTAPIDAGFFVFDIPEAHQVSTRRPVEVTLFDKDGEALVSGSVMDMSNMTKFDTVTHDLPGYPDLQVPVEAIWAKRQQLFDWRADDGERVGLWVAPERGGGICMWSSQASGCGRAGGRPRELPAGVVYRPTLALGLQGGGTHVNVFGSVGPRVARIEARFQDGDRIELRPRGGYLIWPIPSRHYPRGSRLYELVAFDASGQVVARQGMHPNSPSIYPCAKPKQYPYGLTMCP